MRPSLRNSTWRLAALVAATILGCGNFAFRGELPVSQETNESISKKLVDPLLSDLPKPVVEKYQSLFPGHRLWQTLETEKKPPQFELIIFSPDSPWVHNQLQGDMHVRTLQNFRLVLDTNGGVILESAHPVSADMVPDAAKKAFEKWSEGFPRADACEWIASQAKDAERLYSARVVLNSVEWYEALIRGDGTFVKRNKSFDDERVPKSL